MNPLARHDAKTASQDELTNQFLVHAKSGELKRVPNTRSSALGN